MKRFVLIVQPLQFHDSVSGSKQAITQSAFPPPPVLNSTGLPARFKAPADAGSSFGLERCVQGHLGSGYKVCSMDSGIISIYHCLYQTPAYAIAPCGKRIPCHSGRKTRLERSSSL